MLLKIFLNFIIAFKFDTSLPKIAMCGNGQAHKIDKQ